MLDKINSLTLLIGEYYGSKNQVTNISIKLQTIVYIIVFSILELKYFIGFYVFLEIINFVVWYKIIRKGKIDKKLEKRLG